MKNSGFVLLDKPSGISSRHAGRRVARMFGAKTFGHVGTLDPMASGLLVIALGEATKMIPYLKGTGCGSCGPDDCKEYEFSIQWGIETDTLDITGKITNQDEHALRPASDALRDACRALIGEYDQTPPAYSAAHVGGRRAYELARAGKPVNIPARKVKIYELEAGNQKSGNSRFIVKCSPGTYVRSLARDIAEQTSIISKTKSQKLLATCAGIRRTRTNGFDIKNAAGLDFLENLFNNKGRDAIESYLQPPDFGLGDIPVRILEPNDARMFQNGQAIENHQPKAGGLTRVCGGGRFLGIGMAESGLLKPKRVINN
jgi:tRNA pseudouridine55 synthase